MKQRWYDKNKNLAIQLNDFIKAHPETRDKIVRGVFAIIRASDKEIVEHFKVPENIDIQNRRSYDYEPETWIVLNQLQYVNDDLLKKVAEYIEKEIAAQ